MSFRATSSCSRQSQSAEWNTHDGVARAERQRPRRCAHPAAGRGGGPAHGLSREPQRAQPAGGAHRHARPRRADHRPQPARQRGARPRLLHAPGQRCRGRGLHPRTRPGATATAAHRRRPARPSGRRRDRGRPRDERSEGPAPPDAIFAVSEGYAIGALRAARDRGLAVPDDLLLVAGVDSQRASTSDPPITALDLHPADHAAAAIELLVARLQGEQHARTRSVKATLCVRRSTWGARAAAQSPT